MPCIHVLPDLLVNKIAAGEVIERPASVVKELVENSLDAGATRLDIAIEQGGRKLIRIVDNGTGMDTEDLALCVQPHATSKISRENDLFSIQTMGFRGEALPSIGAVSQLRVVSRKPDHNEAYEIRVQGSQMDPVTATAAPPGTTVEVRELFFNVPARQKFLKSAQTEIGHIVEQVARIALVRPQVEFRLSHNGRPSHHLRSAQGMQSRIADFYGQELADALLDIRREERGLKIGGFVGRPSINRSSTKWQYLFLNGRYIRDRLIMHAVKEAYRGLIDSHRHPIVFLTLEIDPANVDVNVHPTKIEVRWRDTNVLYSQVLSALRDRFLNTDLTPDLQMNRLTSPLGEPLWSPPSDVDDVQKTTNAAPQQNTTAQQDAHEVEVPETTQARQQQIRESVAEFFKRARPIADRPSMTHIQSTGTFNPPTQVPNIGLRASITPQSNLSPTSSPTTPVATQPSLCPHESPSDGEELVADKVMQVHRSYLIAESADGITVIDQHALHERILFEQFSKQLSKGTLESQRLLIPETVDVSPDQTTLLEAYAETLQRLGFEIGPYGPRTIAIHAAPTLLRPERIIGFVRDMLDRFADRSAPASTEMITNDLLSMMACKAAVKAGDPLSPEEIQSLLAQRDQIERSSNCPHGRPTSLRLTLTDLERQFKRT